VAGKTELVAMDSRGGHDGWASAVFNVLDNVPCTPSPTPTRPTMNSSLADESWATSVLIPTLAHTRKGPQSINEVSAAAAAVEAMDKRTRSARKRKLTALDDRLELLAELADLRNADIKGSADRDQLKWAWAARDSAVHAAVLYQRELRTVTSAFPPGVSALVLAMAPTADPDTLERDHQNARQRAWQPLLDEQAARDEKTKKLAAALCNTTNSDQ
jgi:hypothetical protein